MVRVKKHLRRRPQEQTPIKVVDRALDMLASRGADQNLRHLCHVQVSNEDSQLVPVGGTFAKGKCSAANLEPRDVQDEVAAATTIFHEAEHAKDVAEHGEEATTIENEIEAHKKTVEFLRKWPQTKTDKRKRLAIARELKDEKTALVVLREEKRKVEGGK